MRLLFFALALFLYAAPTPPQVSELSAQSARLELATPPGSPTPCPVHAAGHGCGDHPDDGLPPANQVRIEPAQHTCALPEDLPPARAVPDDLLRPPEAGLASAL